VATFGFEMVLGEPLPDDLPVRVHFRHLGI
jgi:hypothetical protein